MSEPKTNTPDPNENKETSYTDPSPDNTIDEFTQRLLDKQTEMLLFPDDDSDMTTASLEGSMSAEQRRNAETTMLNALDAMRRERGQKTIEEEEREFSAQHPNRSHRRLSARSKQEKSRPESEKRSLKPGVYEISDTESPKTSASQPAAKKIYQKRSFQIGAVIVCILLLLFGAYALYQPSHASSAQQDAAYARLVNYADEYSMMSDAQKLNLVNLESDYELLPQNKKEEINAYFQNEKHTGKTFDELLEEVRGDVVARDNPSYNDLLSFAQGYNAADESTKAQILTKIDAYHALDEEARSRIDEAMRQTTGRTFVQVYNEYKESHAEDLASVEPVDPAQSAEQTPADGTDPVLRSQLDDLIALREEYAAFLASEGLEEDAILAEYDQQIAELQAQLGQ